MKLKEKLALDYAESNEPDLTVGQMDPTLPAFIAGFEAARKMVAKNLYDFPERHIKIAKRSEMYVILEMGEEEV